MGDPTIKKPSSKLKVSPEKYAIVGAIAFLVGEFVFAAGSAIALAASIQALRRKKAGKLPPAAGSVIQNQ